MIPKGDLLVGEGIDALRVPYFCGRFDSLFVRILFSCDVKIGF